MKIRAFVISLMSLISATGYGMHPAQNRAVSITPEILVSEVYPQILATEDFSAALKLSRLFTLTNKDLQSISESLLTEFITNRISRFKEHPIRVALKIYAMIQQGTSKTIYKVLRNYLKNYSNQDIFNLLIAHLANYTKDKDGCTELKQAIARKDFAQIERIFDGINNELLKSSICGIKERVEELLKQGCADPNFQEGWCGTPLMVAIALGDLGFVNSLLEIPQNLNIHHTTSGNTALMFAIMGENNDIVHNDKVNNEIVMKLLQLGADCNCHNVLGETALFCAISKNHVSIAQALIDHGADVNARTNDGLTPLMFAVMHNRSEIVKILLQAKADVNAMQENRDGKGRLYYRTALLLAVIKGNSTMVKTLLDANAQVNTLFICGTTPLHRAVQQGYVEITELLLDAGADINAKPDYGETALMAAIVREHTQLIEIVLARMLQQNKNHDNDLVDVARIAYRKPNKALWVIQELVKAGADVNAQDHHAKTALSYVANEAGLEQIADFLRDSGAKPIDESPSVDLQPPAARPVEGYCTIQ